jgi:NAD(P)-dependent dehydrogenase (short-subunit alcohol dehydrogenase family)
LSPRGHDLVVGGSGMLSGLVTALAQNGRRVSVIARDPRRLAHLAKTAAGIAPLPLDYHDADRLEAALLQARRDRGPIERAVCWFHTTAPEVPLAVARHVEEIYCHLLGSAAADPSTPTALDRWRASFAALPRLDYRIVVLGFAIEPDGRSRWLTDDEISTGAAEALAGARPLSIVGAVTPWSARP